MPYTADTKLGELLDDPTAYAVMLKHVPEIETAGPMLRMGRGLSLKQISGFPQANMPPEKLNAIVADLAKL
jgi:hypothetical protein